MKTFPFSLDDPENLARLFTLVRGEEVIRFTDHDRDIELSGFTWSSEPGAQMSNCEFFTDGQVSNSEVQLAARTGGPLSDADIAFGRYDGYPFQIAEVDTGNVEDGLGDVFTGFVGSVRVDKFGIVSIDARGPLSKLRANISEQYGPMCRADLFDFRCKVPGLGGTDAVHGDFGPHDIERSTAYTARAAPELSDFVRVRVFANDDVTDYANRYFECTTSGVTASTQPDYSGSLTAGATTTDGSAVFTTRNAWVRHATIDTIINAQAFTLTGSADPRDSVDDWYKLGAAILREGPYADTPIPIRKWTAASFRVDSFLICSHMIEPGMLIEIHRGCAKTEADCNVFNNIINRRAEPFVPGRDAAMAQA